MESSINQVTNRIRRLFEERGQSQYGHEAVTQLEHALQAAALAEAAGADEALITAALLHDIGHLLHDLPEDAPEQGVDDRHESCGARWLEGCFGEEVVEPVRLHVPAKRYLCAVDPSYHARLSGPSRRSLELQGGVMSESEVAAFEELPHYRRAVELRRWDDEAKVVSATTPPLDHFLPAVNTSAIGGEKKE